MSKKITIKSNKITKARNKKVNSNTYLSSFLKILWKISPKVASYIVKRLFFRPKQYKLNNEQRQWIQKADNEFYFTVRGRKLKGWKWGKGPSVLLVHGWDSAGIQLYKFINPILSHGYSVITFDGPAHGVSQGKDTSYFEFSDVVREIIKLEICGEIAGIIGHSMGASALINAMSKEVINSKVVLIAPALPLKEMLFNTFQSYGVPGWMFNKIIEKYEKRFNYSIENDNPINLILKLENPFLIIHDKNDIATPHTATEFAKKINPNITLSITEGLGHVKILFNDDIIEQSISYILNSEIKYFQSSA